MSDIINKALDEISTDMIGEGDPSEDSPSVAEQVEEASAADDEQTTEEPEAVNQETEEGASISEKDSETTERTSEQPDEDVSSQEGELPEWLEQVPEEYQEEAKNGYLRQSDYTKKTQSLSEREKEIREREAKMMEKLEGLYENQQASPESPEPETETEEAPEMPEFPEEVTRDSLAKWAKGVHEAAEKSADIKVKKAKKEMEQQMQPYQEQATRQAMTAARKKVESWARDNNLPEVESDLMDRAYIQGSGVVNYQDVYKIASYDKLLQEVKQLRERSKTDQKNETAHKEKQSVPNTQSGKSGNKLKTAKSKDDKIVAEAFKKGDVDTLINKLDFLSH